MNINLLKLSKMEKYTYILLFLEQLFIKEIMKIFMNKLRILKQLLEIKILF